MLVKIKKRIFITFRPITFIVIILFNFITCFSQSSLKVTNKNKNDFSYNELETKIFNAKDNSSKISYTSLYILKAKKDNFVENIIKGYWMMSETCNFENSLKCTDSMINLSRKFPKYSAKSNYKKGLILYEKRKMKEALNSFLIAYKNANDNNNGQELKHYIYYSIGLIKSIQGNYKEALPIFIECESFAKKNNSSDYLTSLYALAETYTKLNRISDSELYTNIGLKLSNQLNDTVNSVYFTSNKGKNYFKTKNYSKAILTLTKTLKILKNVANDFSNYAENCYYIGESYKAINNTDKTIFYFKKVDSIFTKHNDIYPETLKSYTHLISFYNKKDDLRNTLYYTNKLIKADSIVNANNTYFTEKISKEYELPQLIKSRQEIIKNLKNEKGNFQYVIVSLIIVIILSILFFVFHRKNELKKQKKLFKSFIEKQNSKKSLDIANYNDSKKIEVKEPVSTILNIDQKIIDSVLINLKKFEKDKNFIEKECSIDILAFEFNTNSNYLSKIINHNKGISFPTYLNNLRIDYIIERLENESRFRNYTIQAISESGGYNNVQSFARAFVSRTNVNPSFFIKELVLRNLAN